MPEGGRPSTRPESARRNRLDDSPDLDPSGAGADAGNESRVPERRVCLRHEVAAVTHVRAGDDVVEVSPAVREPLLDGRIEIELVVPDETRGVEAPGTRAVLTPCPIRYVHTTSSTRSRSRGEMLRLIQRSASLYGRSGAEVIGARSPGPYRRPTASAMTTRQAVTTNRPESAAIQGRPRSAAAARVEPLQDGRASATPAAAGAA